MALESTNWLHSAICIAQNWQTLIASIVALIAAYWTIRTIKHQINLDKERYSDIQKSKAWSARAEMPDALSALCNYTENCVAYLLGNDDSDRVPNAPESAIGVIKNSIEYVDPVSARKLFELVVHYQIHNSRLQGHDGKKTVYVNGERIYDSVYLRALVNQLFEYARDEVEAVPIAKLKRADLTTALYDCVGPGSIHRSDETLAPLLEIIKRRTPDS